MQTFRKFFTEELQDGLPLLYRHPTKNNALMVNQEKWAFDFPPKFEMFKVLVNGKIIDGIINPKPSDHNEFELYFPSNQHAPLAYLSLANREEDPLAGNRGGEFRYARFPNQSKKEIIRKRDDLIFGTSEQRTQTHAVILNLSSVTSEIEKYISDPESYSQQLQSETEFKLTDEDKQSIGRSIHSLMNVEEYDGEMKDLLTRLNLLVMNVFLADKENKISNIKDVDVIRIPSKKEMVQAANKNLQGKTITDFNQIEDIAVDHLEKNHSLTNVKRILDKTGSRTLDLISFRLVDLNKGPRVRRIPMIEFFRKTKPVFTTMWPEIEKAVQSGNPVEQLLGRINLQL